ncbi:amino acid transporter AVT1D-like [Corylus avellana]|uniref:amino acid transporter AVT1D-like n=1 Tax=Corylus avellana TaxID=13451 RepID=UPI00286C07C6|nr:amino acid transporter AVT1D-like [Corylus avellana]
MKLNEDLGPDRGDEFQTDDEENEAERICWHEDDTESEDTVSSGSPSDKNMYLSNSSWPQSYRQSMDMFTSVTPPPFINFLRGNSLTGISSAFSTAYKRPQSSELGSSPSKPLISGTSLDKEEVPTYTQPVKLPASKFSISELPPPQEQCSFAQAVINGINVLCGIGLLTTPYAIKEGGWLSLIILLIFGILSCYTGFLLKRCLESSPGLQTYPDIGQAAFGLAGRLGIAIILYVDLYASCVEYIIMMSDNLASLFPNTHLSFAGIRLGSHQTFSILATLFVLPTVWLRNLSLLSYLSGGGVVASILVALCLLWVGVVDQVGFHPTGTALELANLSVTIGIFGFSYSGHSVFPNIYTSMKEPSQFPSVLIASFSFCFFMYTGVAICGFLMFGDKVKSQFSLNMPREFVASNIAIWTMVVNPLTKYALTIAPIALCLEELLPSAQLRSYSVVVLIRTILVFSTLVVAFTFPFFAFVMALIGSLFAMLIALIFPCACYLRLLKGRLTKLQIATSILIMSVGVVCVCIGTYSSITRIADKIG